ncbi:MAG TPA: NUDIX hydrolase [Gammaproteobacteria bacterium]|nr:NUDIX hydrolase [Gammaproteobacteria bacterium]
MTGHRNPWTRVSATTVYENPWIRVEDHAVIDPNGQPGQYGKVCFKSRAIAVLPLDADGFTTLVGQYRYTLDEYSWELPMGGADPGETPQQAGARELREETGLLAGSWLELMRLHTSNSVTDEIGYVFLAQDLSQGPSAPESTETLAIERLPLADALARVLRGEITDAMSVAAILRVARDPGWLAEGR